MCGFDHGIGIARAGKEGIVSRFVCLSALFLWVVPAIAVAQQPLAPLSPYRTSCPATPAVGAISYPGKGKIPRSNNLVQPAGNANIAPGQLVYVMGKVLDANCMPLGDVSVELWQPDPFGKFMIPTAGDFASQVPLFAGAGKTYTDIDGTFSFITLFPGTLKLCERRDGRGRCIRSLERAPFFNLRISGDALRAPYMGGLLFENDRRNATDPVFKRLSAEGRERITMHVLPSDYGDYNTGMRTYIELVVPSKPHWKTY